MPRPGATRRCATTFLDTLDYQASTYAMLGDDREMFLRQAAVARHRRLRRVRAVGCRAARRSRHPPPSTRPPTPATPTYPAYNLTAAELGVQRAERDLPMAWAARVLLILLAAWLGYGIAAGSGRVRWPGAGAARALWVAATRPWRAAEVDRRARACSTGCSLVAVPALALALSRGI